MQERKNESIVPFQSINDAARLTGMSKDFIRKGIRAGTIPAIRTGSGPTAAYMVDVERFLQQLHRAAEQGARA